MQLHLDLNLAQLQMKIEIEERTIGNLVKFLETNVSKEYKNKSIRNGAIFKYDGAAEYSCVLHMSDCWEIIKIMEWFDERYFLKFSGHRIRGDIRTALFLQFKIK